MPDWTGRAAGLGEDPELWFPYQESGGSGRAAKQICRACPVSEPCLSWALLHQELGIWAGTSTRQRERMREAS